MWSYVLSPSPAFVPANCAKLLVIWFVNLKNIHSLKVASYVLFGASENCSKEARQEPGYIEVLQRSQNVKG